MTDRSMVDSSVQSLIPAPRFDPVTVSTRLAFNSFFSLLLLYIVGALSLAGVGVAVFDLEFPDGMDFHNAGMVTVHIIGLYSKVFLLFTLLIPMGGLFILFGGALHGWLVGHLLRWVMPKPLAHWQTVLLGFGISGLFLGGRILIAQWLFGEILAAFLSLNSMGEIFLGLIFWYAPNALLFGGVWWVVYQVNLAMASPLSSPSSVK